MALSVLSITKLRSLSVLLCLVLSQAQAGFSGGTQGSPATGQQASSTGQLHVTVMDPNGQALPAVFVLVEKAGKNIFQVPPPPPPISLSNPSPPTTPQATLHTR